MAQETYLTVDDVARRLQVHADTVRRWIRQKELYAINLGGPAGYRISEAALERFIRERGNRPANEE
jgi:excisionase family DNA binding protein